MFMEFGLKKHHCISKVKFYIKEIHIKHNGIFQELFTIF